MKNACGAALFIVGLLTCAFAADTFDIKVYCAPRITAIDLDGKLAEADWQQAPLVGGFTLYGKEIKAEPQTFFRVAYDDEHLYFGVVCNEDNMQHFAPVPQARDAHAIFSGETIEIFVDPAHTHATYYQFAVNAAASMYDSRGQDPVWSADIRAATAVDKTGWSLEVAVPWEDLGVSPSSGHLLGFNVCRDRQIGGKQWTHWARVISGFHDPIRFAHAILGGNPDQIAGYGKEFRKGDRNGPVVVYTATGFAETSYRALAQASMRRLETRLEELAAQKAKEGSAATQEELGRLINTYRKQLQPLKETLASRETLDARDWSQLDLSITKLLDKLSNAIWTARLNALMTDI